MSLYRNKVATALIIFFLVSSLTIATSHQAKNKIDYNNVNIFTDIKNQNNEKSVIKSTYQPGLYLVHNSHLNEKMTIIEKLKSVDYSIIKLFQEDFTKNMYYPNLPLTFNELASDNLEIQNENIIENEEHDDIEIQRLWDQGLSGNDIVIAIVDTGVDFTHPALEGKMFAEESFHKIQYGFSTDKDSNDENGHGTKVASVAAGYDDGVFQSPAFEAKIVNARIGLESGTSTTLSVVAAFDWAISIPEVDIVSMSLSEPEESFAIDPLEEMMQVGVSMGKIMLSSAGNNGKSGLQPYQIGSPSSSPESISVGASQNGELAVYSSEGPTMGNQMKPDIIAPGTGIMSANLNGGYSSSTGTSFSTPLVAGSIAVLLEAIETEGYNLHPGEVKSLIARSATDLGYQAYQHGFGQINVSKAYDFIINSDFNPIIGPKFKVGFDPNIELPYNTKIFLPISMIGFPTHNFEVSSQNVGIEITHEMIYYGNTSIILLEIVSGLENGEDLLSIDVSYNSDSGNQIITYDIPIETISEPDFTVLLDLKHTIFDSVLFSSEPLKERLERIQGIDIAGFVNVIKSQNGWVTELIYHDYTFEVLSEYDIVWMPSAFSQTLDPLYDHPYEKADFEVEELFALMDYIRNGGSIIADFDGESYYDDAVFTTPNSHLKMFSHLVGIDYIRDNSIEEATFSSINNLYFTTPVNLPNTDIEFMNGIPLISGKEHYSGVIKCTGFGGAIYAHNSRNWRDNVRMSDANNQIYFNNIISFIKEPVIQDIKFTGESISLYLNDSDYLDVYQVYQNVNGEETYINSLNIVESIENNSISIFETYNPLDKIYLDITTGNGQHIIIDEIYPSNGSNLLGYDLNTDSNGTHIKQIQLSMFFDSIHFVKETVKIEYNGILIPFSFNIDGNELNSVTFDGAILPNSIDLEAFEISVIDQYGKLNTFNLIPNSSDTDTVVSDTDDGNIVIILPLMTMTIIVILLIRSKNS